MMRLRNVNRLASLLLMGWLLASCGGGSHVKPEKTNITGTWAIYEVIGDRLPEKRIKGDNYGGPSGFDGLFERHDVGSLTTYPPHRVPGPAKAEVYVSRSGETYWAVSEAPAGGDYSTSEPIGSMTFLSHQQWYRKTSEDAKLEFVITAILLEGMDYNGYSIDEIQCRWKREPGLDECDQIMKGEVGFILMAQDILYEEQSTPVINKHPFFEVGGAVHLHGSSVAGWTALWPNLSFASGPVWRYDDFITEAVDANSRHYRVRLTAPRTIEVTLDTLPVGTEFLVTSIVNTRAVQTRQGEAYMSAYFRDPVNSDGLNVSYAGLEPIEPLTADIPTPAAPTPAPACESPNPAAGTIQFAQPSYTEPEIPGSGAAIIVTRTGGSQGRVSARFTTSDDTAIAGEDYKAVDTYVLFADGEVGSRVVHVPILLDEIEEPDKILNLRLSEPGGCATLGGQRTATLTILDDDRPIIRSDYTVGGTVTGLEGSGLTLSNFGENLIITGGGPFVFSRRYGNTLQYNVRVKTQPTNPSQVCTVTNGSGTIQNANVTHILVTCTEPAPAEDALDPSFGVSGKVTEGLTHPAYGGAVDLALQPDGKIVAVGGARKLARYHADGSLDMSFGTGGVVTVVFQDGGSDLVKGVALQADGKIVVVGQTKAQIVDDRDLDWAVARYHADGSLDTGFGSNGRIINDFGATPFGVSSDGAEKVLIQQDGKIVVAGVVNRADSSGVADSNFVVMRFTASGAIDPSFGPGGAAAANFDRTDILHGAALQPDSKIVVVGRVARSGGADPDIGIARFNMDGSLDTSFGTDGLMRDVTDRMWDEAADVVIQPDGKIVVAGKQGSTFLLARYYSDGNPDSSFGNAGRVSDLFVSAHAYAVALQSDGKIVAVGTNGHGDFGIVRLNPDGMLDSSFGMNGKLTVDFFGSWDEAKALLIQPDGKIIVGGEAQNGSQYGLGLIRVLRRR